MQGTKGTTTTYVIMEKGEVEVRTIGGLRAYGAGLAGSAGRLAGTRDIIERCAVYSIRRML